MNKISGNKDFPLLPGEGQGEVKKKHLLKIEQVRSKYT
jgi:hypothetical protein